MVGGGGCEDFPSWEWLRTILMKPENKPQLVKVVITAFIFISHSKTGVTGYKWIEGNLGRANCWLSELAAKIQNKIE